MSDETDELRVHLARTPEQIETQGAWPIDAEKTAYRLADAMLKTRENA